jgi:hypothetical protein
LILFLIHFNRNNTYNTTITKKMLSFVWSRVKGSGPRMEVQQKRSRWEGLFPDLEITERFRGRREIMAGI